MDQNIHTLALTIYGETQTANISVMEGIANVVLNRVRLAQNGINEWWGKTIKEVCLKPAQFQCWNNPINLNWNTLIKTDPIYQICHRISVRAIKGLLSDNTNGATHYHDINIHPQWAYAGIPCTQISNLLFYDNI
ncbi:MAG: cell wall hydrolase [Alphaproteobacteria bacterium]|nr:cell wall hydrolase [Alphaproteobacteria bacterium]